MKYFFLIITFFALSHCSQKPSPNNPIGKYCVTYPWAGSCPDGYSIVILESDGSAKQIGIGNSIYYEGGWSRTGNGIKINNLGRNGSYIWKNHPHGNGLNKPGIILRQGDNNLFPL